MKRSIALLMAFTAITSLFSCKNKNKDSSSENTVSDTVVTTSADTVQAEKSEKSTEKAAKTQSDSKKSASPSSSDGNGEAPDSDNSVNDVPTQKRELSDADFTDINVNISLMQDVPFDSGTCELSDIDLGSRLSPCKAEGVRDRYIPQLPAEPAYHEEWTHKVCTAICDYESIGMITNVKADGNTLYLIVNYDDLCMESNNSVLFHDISVWSYDMDTKATAEVFRHSSPDKGLSISDMKISNGEVYLICSDEAEPNEEGFMQVQRSKVCHVKDGSLETLYTGKVWNFFDCTDDIAFTEFSEDGNEAVVYVLNLKNGSVTETEPTEKMQIETSNFFTWYGYGSSGDILAVPKKSEDRCLIVDSDYYTLTTEVRGDLNGTFRDRVYVISADRMTGNTKATLYVYDLNKMERYIMDISKIGDRGIAFESGIVLNGGNFHYFIIPDIGTEFPIGFGQSCFQSGERFYTYSASWGRGVRSDENDNIIIEQEQNHEGFTVSWFTPPEPQG